MAALNIQFFKSNLIFIFKRIVLQYKNGILYLFYTFIQDVLDIEDLKAFL